VRFYKPAEGQDRGAFRAATCSITNTGNYEPDENEQIERALSTLSIAQHLEPHDTQTLAALGYVQRRLGNFEAAGRLLQEVVARQSSWDTAQYDLALSLAALQDWEGALLHARAPLRLDPTDKESLISWRLSKRTSGRCIRSRTSNTYNMRY